MINAMIGTEGVFHIGAFIAATGNADHRHPGKLAKLHRKAADRSCRRGYDHGLPRHTAAIQIKRCIGSESRRAQRGQPKGWIIKAIDGLQGTRASGRKSLPAQPTGDGLANIKAGGRNRATRHYGTKNIAVNQLANLERRGVVFEILHALALPRRQGDIVNPYPQLILLQSLKGGGNNLHMGPAWQVNRPFRQHNLGIIKHRFFQGLGCGFNCRRVTPRGHIAGNADRRIDLCWGRHAGHRMTIIMLH